jgi:heme o synthase
MIQKDYAKVGVPMLPVIVGDAQTAKQIWIYTLLMVPMTFTLVYPLHVMGAVYVAIAIFLNIIFVKKAWVLLQTPEDQGLARSLFKYSLLYLMLLSAGMAIDSLPVTHHLTASLTATLTENLTWVLSNLPLK